MTLQNMNLESRTPHPHEPVTLRGDGLTIDEVDRVARRRARVAISEQKDVHARLVQSYDYMQRAAGAGDIIYGVTTGFGGMANVLISAADRDELQNNMLFYHKCGVGARLPIADVRAAMLLRANSHLRGVSGIRLEFIRRIETFLNAGVTPCVPELGSIGASGDLVPLTYVAGALVGHEAGFEVELDGRRMDARKALEYLGLPPIRLESKEALAMLNGTSVMTGIAANCVYEARALLVLALHAHALMLQGMRATNMSFHPFIHAQKPHPGQVWSAASMRRLLAGSGLIRDVLSGKNRNPESGLVQDRYSLRCLPQYLGPIVDGIVEIGKQVEVEMNSANDNPLVDVEGDGIYYGGNFLGQYIGVGMDRLRYDIALLGKHLDVQIALLVAPEFNGGLPPSLVGNPARYVNMGLKGLQIVANSLTPLLGFLGNSLADRYPTHAEQFNQNINSQGTNSANQARRSLAVLRQLVSMALLVGVQAVDMRTHLLAGHYDARRVLAPALVPLYTTLRELTGTAPSAERPWLWDDNQRVLEHDIARVHDDIAEHGKLLQTIHLELPW